MIDLKKLRKDKREAPSEYIGARVSVELKSRWEEFLSREGVTATAVLTALVEETLKRDEVKRNRK